MKKLLAGACVGALLFAASLIPHNPTLSGHPLLAMPITMGMLKSSESTVKSLTYIGTSSNSASSITASHNLGAVHSKKEVFIVAINTGGNTVSAGSSTVGGVAMTKDSEFTAASNCVAVLRLSTPTAAGSTSITITWSGSATVRFFVYVVINRATIGNAPTATNNDTIIGGTSLAANVTIASGGMWLGAASKSNTTAYTSPSSLSAVEDYDASGMCCSSRAFTGTGASASCSWSWATATNGRCGSWAYGA